jgi:hypothetical protein
MNMFPYFISSPENRDDDVAILVDGAFHPQQTFRTGSPYKKALHFELGAHHVELTVNGTFHPKILDMSQDSRALGVHDQVIKYGVVSG